MGDVLSQTEVESLLAALEPPPGAGGAPKKTTGATAIAGADWNANITVYDFKRPERVSKEQMRAFQALHEGFSREFGASLSGLLRTIVEVKLISVDQLTYSEFVFSLENPTCFNLLESKGLDGHLILDLNPSIVYPIVDRLLGGGRNSRPIIPSRPLTDIEVKLVSRITKRAITGLENVWSNLCKLDLEVAQVESNAQLVQIVPPNEVIVLISFEIMMGDSRGIMNLCIPFNTIEPVTGKLSSDTWSAYTKKAADPRQKIHLETGVSQATVELVAHLAETKITTSELMNLEVGDVILTETDQREGVRIFVQGRPLLRAMPGQLKGHKALRITGNITQLRELAEARLAENPQGTTEDVTEESSSANQPTANAPV